MNIQEKDTIVGCCKSKGFVYTYSMNTKINHDSMRKMVLEEQDEITIEPRVNL